MLQKQLILATAEIERFIHKKFYIKKLNLHQICTQNNILSHFSSSENIKKNNFRTVALGLKIGVKMCGETPKKTVTACPSESIARCRVITQNIEEGLLGPPPNSF